MDKPIEICPPVNLHAAKDAPGYFGEYQISRTLNPEGGFIPRLIKITPDFKDDSFIKSGTSDNVIYVVDGDLTFHMEGEEDQIAQCGSTILVRKGTKYSISTKSESSKFFSIVIHIP